MLVMDLLPIVNPMDSVYLGVLYRGTITDESWWGYFRDIPENYKYYKIDNLAALDGINESAYINLMVSEPDPVNNVE